MPYTDKREAARAAIMAAKRDGNERFVVEEYNEIGIMEYHVCDEYAVDTFYNGCPIIFSTAD